MSVKKAMNEFQQKFVPMEAKVKSCIVNDSVKSIDKAKAMLVDADKLVSKSKALLSKAKPHLKEA